MISMTHTASTSCSIALDCLASVQNLACIWLAVGLPDFNGHSMTSLSGPNETVACASESQAHCLVSFM